jgi:TP901 family phage tail tape measure protein
VAIRAGELIAYVFADTAQAEAALARTGRAFEGTAAAANRGAAGGIARFGKSVATVGVIVGAFAIKQAVDYQAAMTKVGALTHASADEMAFMNGALLKLAPTIGAEPKKLADALYFVESAGYHGAQALDILKISGEAAATGLGKVEDVTALVVGAMNAYSSTGLTAKQATDGMVAAITAGHIPAGNLASAMGRVQGAMAGLHIPFNEVLANIATLSRTNMSTEQAATSLQSVATAMFRMNAPSKQISQGMQELGLNAQQVTDVLTHQGLHAALQLVKDAMDKTAASGGNVDAAVLKLFPNVRALRDVLSTVGVQGQAYNDILNEINHSTDGLGRTQQAFNATTETSKFKLKELRSEAEVLGVKLGTWLIDQFGKLAGAILDLAHSPGMHDFIESLKNLAHTLSTFWDKISPTFISALHGIGQALVDWLGALSKFVDTPFGKIATGLVLINLALQKPGWLALFGAITAFGWIYDHNKAVADGLALIAAGFWLVSGAASAAGVSAISFTGAMYGVAAAVGILAIYEGIKHWRGLKTAVVDAGHAVSWFIRGVMDKFSGHNWANAFGPNSAFGKAITFHWLGGTGNPISRFLGKWIHETGPTLSGFIKSLGPNGAFGRAITFTWLPGALKGLGHIFADLGRKAWGWGHDLVAGLVNGIKSGISSLLKGVGNWFSHAIIDTIKRALGISSPSTIMFRVGVDVVKGLVNGLVSMFGALLGAVGRIPSRTG